MEKLVYWINRMICAVTQCQWQPITAKVSKCERCRRYNRRRRPNKGKRL